ncbi:malonic semialdehyde reductase [Janthinobacterium sp. 17J80-10]|uniref:malonic semialdehyde reductase n=1 Tax=Janthinobacterium sp. 17J80-10 TaxID=2497863 RepID=UPI0010052933|nr:malonic semialdehyde reductase [Janthinobacterium sp. 17J80-10]QAU33960.1 malonic semialdehyde reductase [Janthinobacterium sp. 17J80-10]
MSAALDARSLDQLFREARTYNHFSSATVSDETLRSVYDLVKFGPTAFNAQPTRYVFIRSQEAKARLAPALSSSNRDKTLAAPVNVLIAYDSQFHEHLPKLTASPNAKELFEKVPELVEPTALRSGSLQAAYLVVAARALGLDVGVLTGFKPELVNAEFFPDGRYKVNVIANLGYDGDSATLRPRAYRFAFEEVAQLL